MRDEIDSSPSSTSRRPLLLLGLGAAFLAGLGLLLLREIGFDRAIDWIMDGWALLQAAPPIVFFGAMSILTIFPVPVTPFYITAGTLYGIVPSLLWIPPAVLLNNFISYTLTTTFLRPWLQGIVARRGYSIPTLHSKREQMLFIGIVRITPGPPYFLQSLVLGLAGVARLPFLVLSLPLHMIFVVGFVVLGQSAFDGQFGLAIGGLALILTASICARFAHKRLRAMSGSDAGGNTADITAGNAPDVSRLE